MSETPNHTRNLDDGIVEHFDFIIKGHTYRFRQPNTDELEELRTLKDDSEKGKEVLYKFISKISEGAPDFKKIAKKMTVPYWHRFNKMISEEMSSE